MVEEIKYYTPSIEEFHIGFEYEEKLYNGKWTKEEVSYRFFEEPYEEEDLRVKYLDKSDIESCGFKPYNNHDTYIYKNKYRLEFHNNPKGYNFQLKIYEEHKCDIGGSTIYFINLFKGFIKNKSELKVLLKQLGINE